MSDQPDEFDPYFKWLGIPPEEQSPNHYRLLGIPEFVADADVIEAAADQRMLLLKTYQTGKRASHSQAILNEVSAAKTCLLNSERKAAYDAKLRDVLEQSAEPEPPPHLAPAAASPPAPRPSAAGPSQESLPAVKTRGSPASRRNRRSRRKKTIPPWAIPGAIVAALVVAISGWFLIGRPKSEEPSRPGKSTTFSQDDDRPKRQADFQPAVREQDETTTHDKNHPIKQDEPEVARLGGLAIVALLPDPAGKDAGNEQVTLRNSSRRAVSVDGWKLIDKAGNSFPLTGLIGPDSEVVITMTKATMPLNNDGDTLILLDSDGVPRSRVTYLASHVQPGVTITFPPQER